MYHSSISCPISDVPRHAGRVIFLEYEGEGPIDTTLILVGKVKLWSHNGILPYNMVSMK